MLVGRCSSELAGHRLQGKLKKSQPPSEAEGSAVPRTTTGNAEYDVQIELSSRPERSAVERSAVSFSSHLDSKALMWSAVETVPFVHQADPKKSLPFRKQPIKQGNLILLSPILLKAINKLPC